jgi:hypothetical protein
MELNKYERIFNLNFIKTDNIDDTINVRKIIKKLDLDIDDDVFIREYKKYLPNINLNFIEMNDIMRVTGYRLPDVTPLPLPPSPQFNSLQMSPQSTISTSNQSVISEQINNIDNKLDILSKKNSSEIEQLKQILDNKQETRITLYGNEYKQSYVQNIIYNQSEYIKFLERHNPKEYNKLISYVLNSVPIQTPNGNLISYEKFSNLIISPIEYLKFLSENQPIAYHKFLKELNSKNNNIITLKSDKLEIVNEHTETKNEKKKETKKYSSVTILLYVFIFILLVYILSLSLGWIQPILSSNEEDINNDYNDNLHQRLN